jgi:N-acyl-D-aspartate/D-glutamate deacylase
MDGLNRASTDYDLIIKNGTLVDGTGNTAKTGNIALKDGKIAAVGEFNRKGR